MMHPSLVCFCSVLSSLPSPLSLTPRPFLGLVLDPDATLFRLEEVVLDVVCLAHLDVSNLGDGVPLIGGLEQPREQGTL
jgi:hypothetical protein